MADVKWIKITTDIFDDEKILLIESLPDAYSIITVWFKLLCLAGKQNNSGVFMLGRMPYTDKMLSTIFRMNEATVTMALQTFEQFGMVEIVDGVITIPNWEKHQSLDQLEQAKENTRKRVARHREKQKFLAQNTATADCNATVTLHVTPCNGDRIEEDKEEDKDKEEKSKKENTRTLFDRLLPEYNLPEALQAKMGEWITYKIERKEQYQEQGMKTLLRKVENNQLTYGEQALCDLIDDCMASGWKGIIFDRLADKKKAMPQQQRGSFETEQFFKRALKRSYGDLEMHKSENPKTAADDEGIRKRAANLKAAFAKGE